MEKILSIVKPEAAPVDSGPTCQSCPFWFVEPETKAQGGFCRYNPPAVIAVPVMTRTLAGDQMGMKLQPFAPLTEPGYWCSRHPDRDAQIRVDMILDVLDVLTLEFPALRAQLVSMGMVVPAP